MDIDKLNARYGAPGRIVFHRGYAGYPEVVLSNRFGVAELALLGANVLSYRPTGHSPVIFRPAKRDYNRGESFHGGIPVCWPQFGNRFSKALPQHGFARIMPFEVRASEYSEEMTEITIGLKSDDETKKLWPHDFDLEFKVSVSMKLNLRLTTANTGTAPFDFSCGFHPYFIVRDVADVAIRGLEGTSFVDGNHMDLGERVQTGDFPATNAPDHIFTLPDAPKHEFAILDGGLHRAIAIASSGNGKTVVWNCGPDARPADFASDDWRRYVCVEPVSDWPAGRTLAPNERHVLTAAIQSTMEERA